MRVCKPFAKCLQFGGPDRDKAAANDDWATVVRSSFGAARCGRNSLSAAQLELESFGQRDSRECRVAQSGGARMHFSPSIYVSARPGNGCLSGSRARRAVSLEARCNISECGTRSAVRAWAIHQVLGGSSCRGGTLGSTGPSQDRIAKSGHKSEPTGLLPERTGAGTSDADRVANDRGVADLPRDEAADLLEAAVEWQQLLESWTIFRPLPPNPLQSSFQSPDHAGADLASLDQHWRSLAEGLARTAHNTDEDTDAEDYVDCPSLFSADQRNYSIEASWSWVVYERVWIRATLFST